MDVLIFVAVLLLLIALAIGYVSMQHTVIKAVVGRLHPAPPESEPLQPITDRDIWLAMVRARKRDRLAMRNDMER